MLPTLQAPSNRRRLTALLLAGCAALAAGRGLRAAEAYHRIDVRPAQGAPLPYTVEVPLGWEIVQAAQVPGLWIGPPDAKPPSDPRLIYVRGSQVSLADPEAIAENIRKNDAAQAGWTAPRVEVREVGGVKAVLVRMDTGTGEATRSTLALKLPLWEKGVDFLCQGGIKDFEKHLAQCERILLSVRPVAEAAPAAVPPK